MVIKYQLLTKFKRVSKILAVISLSLFSACSFGEKMKAEEFFDNGMVLLLKTIVRGDVARAKEMIQQGADLNIHGDEGITPLFWLIINKDLDAIELALQLGANPNFISGDNDHPVAYLVGDGDDAILALLLKYGGDANAVDHNDYPVIFEAIGHDNWTHINLLLEAGADLNKTNKSNNNAALYATSLNKFEICFRLIELGSDYHEPSTGGATIANRIEKKLSKNLLNPEFKAYGWAIKTKELLIEKGINFPPYSPNEVRERIKNGLPIN